MSTRHRPTFTRRTFLESSVVAAGVLMLGVEVASSDGANATDARFAPDAFIRIDSRGRVTLIMPQTEMGQGVYTGIAMILAEELDAAYDQIVLEAAPPNEKLYANPVLTIQATGGSTSIRAFWAPLRHTAACARLMLVQAAAKQWKVDPGTLSTARGEVIDVASGRRIGYGSLVSASWHALVLRCSDASACDAAIDRLRQARSSFEAIELEGRKRGAVM